MTRVFSTPMQLQSFMEIGCSKAVNNTCNRLLGELQKLIISEFYDVYDTDTYKRTYQFYKSALTKMLTLTCGEIFMDANKINYPFSGHGWSWDGERQLQAANKGVHGGWSTEESLKHRYWESFEKYCDHHALKILKEELNKQGISVT